MEWCIWSVALPFADYVDSVHLYETPKKVSRRPIRSLFRGLAGARKKYAPLRTVDYVPGSTKVRNVVEKSKTLAMEKLQDCVSDGISLSDCILIGLGMYIHNLLKVAGSETYNY